MTMTVAWCVLSAVALGAPTLVAGVSFEAERTVDQHTLRLNGAGVRTRLFFKVYAAGLYVPQVSKDPHSVLTQSGARLVQLVMLRTVDADTFADALDEGLRNNHTPEQLEKLHTHIQALHTAIQSLGAAKKGDRIGFEYTPALGTRIWVNGSVHGGPIGGEDFFNAVLRIWIGTHPADPALKSALLGIAE